MKIAALVVVLVLAGFANVTLAQTTPAPASEIGARYWTSTGHIDWAFAFADNRGFGDPTSTIEWKSLKGHVGEVFGRYTHRESGIFVKGLFGEGHVTKGKMTDRDFFNGQSKFMDTSGQRMTGNTSYAMSDVGIGYDAPESRLHLGVFGGYHYWRGMVTSIGVVDNLHLYDFSRYDDTPAVIYEPTWHALRIGVEGRIAVSEKLSVNGEIAWVPRGRVTNDDSHLLKTSMNGDGYGPTPNVLTRAAHVRGRETEGFVNYSLKPTLEIGLGVRYWRLGVGEGIVEFGTRWENYPLRKLEEARYGLLMQIHKKF